MVYFHGLQEREVLTDGTDHRRVDLLEHLCKARRPGNVRVVVDQGQPPRADGPRSVERVEVAQKGLVDLAPVAVVGGAVAARGRVRVGRRRPVAVSVLAVVPRPEPVLALQVLSEKLDEACSVDGAGGKRGDAGSERCRLVDFTVHWI